MNKKIKIIFFAFLSTVFEQHSMFRNGLPGIRKELTPIQRRLIQLRQARARARACKLPQISAFTEIFLKMVKHDRRLIKGIQLFSQARFESPTENQLFKLRCEDGVDVSIGVTQSVAHQQKEMLEEIKNNGASVICLPESYDYLDWQVMCDNDGEWTGEVKFVENYEYDSAIQAVFISYYTKERIVSFGKDKETVTICECPANREILDKLEEKFRNMLEQNIK